MSTQSYSSYPIEYFRDFKVTDQSRGTLRDFISKKRANGDSGASGQARWITARDYSDRGIWTYKKSDPSPPRAGETDEANISFTAGPTNLDSKGQLSHHQYNTRTTGHAFFDPITGEPAQIALWFIPYSSPGEERQDGYTVGTPDNAGKETITINYGGSSNWDGEKGTAIISYHKGEDGNSARETRIATTNEIGSAILQIAPESNIFSSIPANWQGENLFENSPTFTPSSSQDNETGKGGSTDYLSPPSSFTKATADKITNFNPKKDSISIETEAYGIDGSPTFKRVRTTRALKKAAQKGIDFIYSQDTGMLYFDENGSESGMGNGGITATIAGSPKINSGNIIFS